MPESHDPIREWHAQKGRAELVLDVCAQVCIGELPPSVATVALLTAGVDADQVASLGGPFERAAQGEARPPAAAHDGLTITLRGGGPITASGGLGGSAEAPRDAQPERAASTSTDPLDWLLGLRGDTTIPWGRLAEVQAAVRRTRPGAHPGDARPVRLRANGDSWKADSAAAHAEVERLRAIVRAADTLSKEAGRRADGETERAAKALDRAAAAERRTEAYRAEISRLTDTIQRLRAEFAGPHPEHARLHHALDLCGPAAGLSSEALATRIDRMRESLGAVQAERERLADRMRSIADGLADPNGVH